MSIFSNLFPSKSEEPKLIAEMSPSEKRAKADEIFKEFDVRYFPRDMVNACQHDFKTCSLVAYKLVREYYDPNGTLDKSRISGAWGGHYDIGAPLRGPAWLPVRYIGGDMCVGRIFAFNICAFSSPDSIVGMRCLGGKIPHDHEMFRVLKGMKYIGDHKEWTLFKLDPATTDDMTATLFTRHEKNFDLQFAHFPHDAPPRILFFWVDS